MYQDYWLYLVSISVLIFYYFYVNHHFQIHEGFESKKRILFARCRKMGLGGTLKKVFDKHGIDKCQKGDHCDVYIPCGYTGVERELDKMNNPIKKQLIFGITGCDQIVSKNNLWNLLSKKYGRKQAGQYAPQTFLIDNSGDMNLFQKYFNPNKIYVAKSNQQRQEGIKLVKGRQDLQDVLKEKKYRLIQECLTKPYIIADRKTNLRIYLLILCQNSNMKAFLNDKGFVYYTKKPYMEGVKDHDRIITTGYIDREIYQKNPHTLADLRKYLKHKSQTFDQNVRDIIRKIMDAIHQPLCQNPKFKDNTTFQLFGVDLASDQNLKMKIMEINKGPDMNAKDQRDGKLKYLVQEDIFNLLGVIPLDRKNGFQLVWKN